jgi:hypothetical protein
MKGSKSVGDADIRRDFPGGWAADQHSAFCSNEDLKCRGHQTGRTPEEEAYFQFTKTLLNWRKGQKVIHEGKLLQFVPQNNLYVYFRYLEPIKEMAQPAEVVMVIINNSKEEQTLNWSRFSEGFFGFDKGKDVLTNQTFDFEVPTGKVPAKTSYIIKLSH